MTENEALAILGIEKVDAELISDAYEVACFHEKKLFYKDPVLPSLIENKLKKITNLSQALLFLMPGSPKSETLNYSLLDLEVEDWDLFFLNYEKNKAVLRKELTHYFTIDALRLVLEDLKGNEIRYMNRLIGLKPLLGEGEHEAKISIQQPIIELLNELNHFLEQGVIDKSWESLSRLSHIKDNFKLQHEISRANKILNG